ncbi:MAG: DUF4270 domain-containing protein [Bacteroidia bacterium]|nr:DUF4270 domain-containing protein [Bacteroidia bacterium]
MWLSILIGVAATTFLVSCDTSAGSLGSDVLPADDLVGLAYSDTFSLSLQTVRVDSINTYNASRQLFGNYVDPLFGTITAKTFTQVFPRSGLNFGKASELIFDSLVLKLRIESAYGRVDQPQTLRVHTITGDWPDTTILYSSSELGYDPKDLAKGKVLDLSTSTVNSIVRLRLDDQLGKDILFGDSATLADRNLFITQVLKGIVLETDPVPFLSREPGAIFSMVGNLSDSLLILYYQKFDAATQTYLRFREPFLLTSSTPRYHTLSRRSFEGTLINQAISSPDTSTQYEFISSGLLTKTWVQFPTLNFDEPTLVAKAELILPIDPSTMGSNDRYFPPFEILALRADETGTELLEDGFGLSVSSSSTALTYDSDRQAYVIPITGYMQRLFNGSIVGDNGFLVVPSDARSSIRRVVLCGTHHPNPDLRPRLELTTGSVPR